jgi:hypothetical protein
MVLRPRRGPKPLIPHACILSVKKVAKKLVYFFKKNPIVKQRPNGEKAPELVIFFSPCLPKISRPIDGRATRKDGAFYFMPGAE